MLRIGRNEGEAAGRGTWRQPASADRRVGVSLGTQDAGRIARAPGRVATIPWNASQIFAGALALQLFHQLEHVVQVAQAKVFGIKPAHGILGSLVDLEWVHFVYNNGLYILLFVATVVVLRDHRIRPPVGWLWLGATLAVQTYHVFEHVVKIAQHITTGADPAPGILGFVIDLVWLHFSINLAVTICMIGAFFGLGMYRELRPSVSGADGAGAARVAIFTPKVIGIAVAVVAVGVALGLILAPAR